MYRDGAFEYPPYALVWFSSPTRSRTTSRASVSRSAWRCGWSTPVIKALLLWRGMRARTGVSDLVPFLAYSVGSAALGYVLLQRYDLVPAALTLGATLAVAGGWAFLGGFLVALVRAPSSTRRC